MDSAGAEQSVLPVWTFVGFTGHRALGDPEKVSAAVAKVVDRLTQRNARLAGISSIASGADTLFVEELARQDVPFFLVLPFSLEKFRCDFEAADWQRVEPLLERALDVEMVAEAASRSEGYLEAGVVTVDEADVVIAVWNGKPAAGRGGTAQVVEYARAGGKPVILIDSETGAITEERMDRLPRHALAGESMDDPRGAVETAFAQLDREATAHGPRARHQILRMIGWHLLAAAVALAPLAFHRTGIEVQIALGIEVGCLIAALVVGLRHRHAHHAWMQSRIAAELCRSFLALWRQRRQSAALPKAIPEGHGQLARSLRMAWFLDRAAAAGLEEARDHYLEHRVVDQMSYFQRHRLRSEGLARWLKRVVAISTIGAIVFALLALVLSIMHRHGWDYSTSKLLSLLLPLVSAGLLSLLVAHDVGRRAVRYRQMASLLEDAQRRLHAVRTWPSLERIVAETEEALLREVVEWHTVTRFTAESH